LEYHGIEWPLHGIYPVVIKQVAMGRNHCWIGIDHRTEAVASIAEVSGGYKWYSNVYHGTCMYKNPKNGDIRGIWWVHI
jgi:hypothetical protein